MGSGLSGWVDTILTVLFVLVGLLMTFFILLQEGKGGGLAALGGTKAAGVEGVTNPIRRATGYLAGLFFALAIILGIMHKPEKSINFSSTSGMSGAAAKTDDKKSDAPKAEAPKTEAPKAEAPKTEEKKAEAPKAEEKKTEAAPATETKPADAPKTEEKKAEEKKDGAAAPATTPPPAAPATEKK